MIRAHCTTQAARVVLAAIAIAMTVTPALHAQGTPILSTVAGTGKAGYAGDGGPAAQALLNMPYGVAISPNGLLYFSEHGSDTVRRVNADGTIQTVAGIGRLGRTGDGGPASQARLADPLHLAFDAAGNLFIADTGNNRVRKVAPDGTITNYAGGGSLTGNLGDNGPATGAGLRGARGLAVDSAGNLYIGDTDNFRVRKVTPEGIITTVAGSGKKGFSGDGGPATEARINTPAALAVDGLNNLYIVEYGDYLSGGGHRVRKVSPDGIIRTIAGSLRLGFNGDGGPAVDAAFNFITAVVADSVGNLFISDWGNHRIRKVNPMGIISTVVGNGEKSLTGAGVSPTATGLRGPWGLALDGQGNLFIADTGYAKSDGAGMGERILKVTGIAAPGLLAGRLFQSP